MKSLRKWIPGVFIVVIGLCWIASAQTTENVVKSLPLLEVDTKTLDPAAVATVGTLKIYGRFISSTELENNPLFQSPEKVVRNPNGEEIYLLTLVRRNVDAEQLERGQGFSRILSLQAKVTYLNKKAVTFSLIPRSLGARGQCWNLVQLCEHDDDLDIDIRRKILRSKPEISISGFIVK